MPAPFLVPLGMIALKIAGKWVLRKMSQRAAKKQLQKIASQKRRNKIQDLQSRSQSAKQQSRNTDLEDLDFKGQLGVNKRGYKPGEKFTSKLARKRRHEAVEKRNDKAERFIKESRKLEKDADKLRAPGKEEESSISRAYTRATDFVAKKPAKGFKPGIRSKFENVWREFNLAQGKLARIEDKAKGERILQAGPKKKRIRKRPNARTRAKAEQSAKRSRDAADKRTEEKFENKIKRNKDKIKRNKARQALYRFGQENRN